MIIAGGFHIDKRRRRVILNSLFLRLFANLYDLRRIETLRGPRYSVVRGLKP